MLSPGRAAHHLHALSVPDLSDAGAHRDHVRVRACRPPHLHDRAASGGPIEWFMGDSRGRWEGDTLVVDVVHFTDQTWFDRSGNFHSAALHVVERYTPIDANHINYEATIEDPKVFTRPWKMSMALYRRLDRACGSWKTNATRLASNTRGSGRRNEAMGARLDRARRNGGAGVWPAAIAAADQGDQRPAAPAGGYARRERRTASRTSRGSGIRSAPSTTSRIWSFRRCIRISTRTRRGAARASSSIRRMARSRINHGRWRSPTRSSSTMPIPRRSISIRTRAAFCRASRAT